jgi:glycerophosphoryl diester phosphodiesterase
VRSARTIAPRCCASTLGLAQPAFAGERLPTLARALDCLLSLNLAANIEIKPAAGYERITGEVAARMIARRWPADVIPPLLSSFSMLALTAASEVAPHLPRGLLFDAIPDDWAALVRSHGAVSVHCNQAGLRSCAASRRCAMRLCRCCATR